MPDWNLDRIADRFQQAAFEPSLWSETLHGLSQSVGALGAVMLPLDHRVVGPPCSPDIKELTDDYFREGWQTRDDRDQGVPLILGKGVVCDQDFITPAGMRRPYYRDLLERHGCRWFAGMGHLSQSGFHAISIQRTIRQGPFQPEEMRRLSTLCRAFADAGFLSRRLGLQRCAGLVDAMEIMRQPAIVLDRSGQVLALNGPAEQWMGDGVDLVGRRPVFRDPASQAGYEALVAKAMDTALKEGPVSDSAVVRDRDGLPLQLRAVALRDWTRFTFTGARALIVFDRLPARTLLQAEYGLTKAELKLALLLASGRSLAQSATFLGVSYETARSQLRSVFSKTDTHRQGELVARLRNEPEPGMKQ